MLPLERYRLAALGHTPEHINAIEVYEQKVKEEMVAKLVKVIRLVPEYEFTKSPYYVKEKLEQLFKDILR